MTTINIIKCQSGDIVSTLYTEMPIQFSANGQVIITDIKTGKLIFLYPSDIKYITTANVDKKYL